MTRRRSRSSSGSCSVGSWATSAGPNVFAKGGKLSPAYVRCDHKAEIRYAGEPDGCCETFLSYSRDSVVREQARIAGWNHDRGRDLCPQHGPRRWEWDLKRYA